MDSHVYKKSFSPCGPPAPEPAPKEDPFKKAEEEIVKVFKTMDWVVVFNLPLFCSSWLKNSMTDRSVISIVFERPSHNIYFHRGPVHECILRWDPIENFYRSFMRKRSVNREVGTYMKLVVRNEGKTLSDFIEYGEFY